MDNLRSLPKFRDGLTSLYFEHGRLDRHEHAVAFHDAQGGMTPVPVASLGVLMLGPGTTVTQAAVVALADNNCLTVWCGEENVRFYAAGVGGTRSARAVIEQARLSSDPQLRLEVVARMYRMRFAETVPADITIQQLRGKEGMRVRAAYQEASREFGVPWTGRNYDRGQWAHADPVNRALSAANSCLDGLCHAAILSAGFSPALGFVHTGKQLSFVYDVADLYKTEVSVPVAFGAAAEGADDLERRMRLRLRDQFRETRLLQRVIPDLHQALGLSDAQLLEDPFAEDAARPADWWDPDGGESGDLTERLV